MINRFMKVIVLFDLPVSTKEKKKAVFTIQKKPYQGRISYASIFRVCKNSKEQRRR